MEIMGKYRRKVIWIVKRHENYGRKVSWIVKRFGKYRRKSKLNSEKIGKKVWENEMFLSHVLEKQLTDISNVAVWKSTEKSTGKWNVL